MTDLLDRLKVRRWLKSWKYTFLELKHFIATHALFVIAGIMLGYGLLYGVLIGQYYIVKAQPGSDFLNYNTVVVNDIHRGDLAKGFFVRDSKGNYDGYGKVEFSSLDNEDSTYLPPPINYPKAITKGHEEIHEFIPTQDLAPGKYSFILQRKFEVDTWIGRPVEKQVTVVSDDFTVSDQLTTPEDYLLRMEALYLEFVERLTELTTKYPELQYIYVPTKPQSEATIPDSSPAEPIPAPPQTRPNPPNRPVTPRPFLQNTLDSVINVSPINGLLK